MKKGLITLLATVAFGFMFTVGTTVHADTIVPDGVDNITASEVPDDTSAVESPLQINSSTSATVPGVVQNGPTIPIRQISPMSTVKGAGGYSKTWVSGGRIYFAIKPNFLEFPTYWFKGNLKIKFSNGKTRNFSVGGTGIGGRTWTGYRTYRTYGSHGAAYFTGMVFGATGATANILHPSSAF
ncbi:MULTISPECIES: hypothetical protein [Lacticaseibacillus]|uniref:hypothetical protein n=1 Tax=Lacticaseibacillus TaxID=2759736 RepID=UPI0019438F76|nr:MULTISPECIES: hypothetical protein [Lacticaseibacillus]